MEITDTLDLHAFAPRDIKNIKFAVFLPDFRRPVIADRPFGTLRENNADDIPID